MLFDFSTVDTPAEIALFTLACFLALNILIVWLINAEFLFACYRSFFGFLFNPRTTNVHGSAHWLTGLPKYFLMSKNKNGLLIDGKRSISERRSFMHMAISAPSGMGKTWRFIIGNILKFRNASYVITDPSGEIYEVCAGLLKWFGFDIRVINLSDPFRSLQYNCLTRAKTHSDLRKLAEILISNVYPDSSGDNKFWIDGAIMALTVLLKCLKKDPVEFQNLANLKYLVDSFGSDGEPLLEYVADRADEATFKQFEAFLDQSEKVLQSMISTCKTALELYDDPEMQILTAQDTIRFEDCRTQRTCVFLVVPENLVRFYGSFLATFYTQLFDFAMKSKRELGLFKSFLPLYCFCDEFGNSGKIPGFSQIATTIRKKKVSLSIILQHPMQLEELYGRSAATIFGSMASKLFLPGLPLEACKQVEQMAGYETVLLEDRPPATIDDPWPRPRISEARRALMTSEEVRTMSDNTAIFIHANKHPVLIRTRPYYKKWSYKLRLFRTPPELPQIPHTTPPPLIKLNQKLEQTEHTVKLLTDGSGL